MHAKAYLASIVIILAAYLAAPLRPSIARVRASFATHATPVMTSRVPVKSVYAHEQDEGVGARVRRSIGGMSLRHIDPFLMLDHFSAFYHL